MVALPRVGNEPRLLPSTEAEAEPELLQTVLGHFRSGNDFFQTANFLDIGTVNDVSRVVNSFRILSEDPNVRAVLINIFGGMARVDVIAQGVVDAHKEMAVRVPVVTRLAGTNLEEGERILKESGLPVIRAADLGEAAKKAVAAARG